MNDAVVEVAIATIIADDAGILCYGYPHSYFDPITGKGPQTATEAERWWEFRHRRPMVTAGVIEQRPDNFGQIMMEEVQHTREDLRIYVHNELVQAFCQKLQQLDINMPSDNQPPQYGNDVKRIIINWENNISNHGLVFKIFHEFHRSRTWLSATVDSFLKKNHMFLLPAPKTSKIYVDVRGGFGTVARRTKAQTLRKYMNYLFKSQGWMVSTTLSSKLGDNRLYERVTNEDHYNKECNPDISKDILYYIITQKNNDSHVNVRVGGNIDKYFNIDYNKLMKNIISLQKQTQNNMIPPDDLKILLLQNSKITQKNEHRLKRDLTVQVNKANEKFDMFFGKKENNNIEFHNDGTSNIEESTDDEAVSTGSGYENIIQEDNEDDVSTDTTIPAQDEEWNNRKMIAVIQPHEENIEQESDNDGKIKATEKEPGKMSRKPKSLFKKKMNTNNKQNLVTKKNNNIKATSTRTTLKSPPMSLTKSISIIPFKKNVFCMVDHDKASNYNPNTIRSYFTEAYYKKKQVCTKECSECKRTFGTDIKISTKSPVMCCSKQFDKVDPCIHAYCTPCFSKWQGYT